jgi:hypothetical protein
MAETQRGEAAQAAAPTPTTDQPERNGKALASLVTGILGVICLPTSIAAVILGHMSRSEIRKSRGRQKGKGMALAGLILGYFGSAYSAIAFLIIASIAIPNLLRSRIEANEASTIGSLGALNVACVSYASTYGQLPPNLKSLGPAPAGAESGAHAANLIDLVLASGTRHGYRFSYQAIDTDGDGKYDAYVLTADPITPGTTGERYFFTDQTGVIRVGQHQPATAESPPI